MRRRTLLTATLAAGLAGCGAHGDRLGDLRIMVPNPPGSGYDITARVLARALDAGGVVRGVEVFNVPGGGGVVALRRLVYERGNGRLLLLMGLGLVGAEIAADADVTLASATPVARLVQEPAVLVVRRDSPYGSLDDLVSAWRADPSGVPVGGGSSAGGPDHLATMLLAEAVGLEPSDVAYQRHDGGGDLLAAILGREVAFAASGSSEYADQIQSGQLRALAVTSAEPVRQIPAPTVRSAGLDIVFNNWRGVLAPPGLSEEDSAAIRDVVAALETSRPWADARARFGWVDAHLTGDRFADFVADERSRVAGVLRRLGLSART